MKKLISIVFISLLNFTCHAQKPTANQVVEKVKASLTCEWNPKTVDTFKAGDPNKSVTGVASTFMATLEVLKEAKAKGLNFVITHEPTFYNHMDDLSLHEKETVQQEKLKFIEENNMVVWRFHDHMHRTNPDQIYEGVIDQLGWKTYKANHKPTFTIPEQNLKSIAQEMKAKLNAETIRVVGNPEMNFSKVGFALGAAGTGSHFRMMADPDCEVLVVGESNEWETVPFVQDAISQGKKKALIVVGHADSEEAGMVYFASWLQKLCPELKIEFIKAGNPYWSPR